MSAQTEQRPVIKEAGGYWPLPQAAVQPEKSATYKAIFDATRPAANRKVAVIFHGEAVYGIFDNATYRAK